MTASYLLKASDEDMERWKRAARERGLSFAQFVREAIETWCRRTSREGER
jgi:predicted DNA binding CopG/RHH family protein